MQNPQNGPPGGLKQIKNLQKAHFPNLETSAQKQQRQAQAAADSQAMNLGQRDPIVPSGMSAPVATMMPGQMPPRSSIRLFGISSNAKQPVNSTISKDKTKGDEARNKALLAEFGWRTQSRAFGSSGLSKKPGTEDIPNIPAQEPAREVDSDSLNDEIIETARLYTEVSFDHVDLDKRSISMSLYGPWGEGVARVYLKVKIDFPIRYPVFGMPMFTISESPMIPETTYKKLNDRIRQILNSLVLQKKRCLGTITNYLLEGYILRE